MWQIESLAATEQLHNIPHAIVDRGAIAAAFKVTLDVMSRVDAEFVFKVVRKLAANQTAIEFYRPAFGGH